MSKPRRIRVITVTVALLTAAGIGAILLVPRHQMAQPAARVSAARPAAHSGGVWPNTHLGFVPRRASAGFHYYNPLHDPPPSASPQQIKDWGIKLENRFLTDGLQPDFSGPPLASLYKTEAALANQGNTRAATMLFKGLEYCVFHSLALPDNPPALKQKIAQMKATHEDMYHLHTSHLASAITRLNETYHFCLGETHPKQTTIEHWARIAAWSLNPRTMWAVMYSAGRPSVLFGKDTPAAAERTTQMITDRAARAGLASAWISLSKIYLHGWYGHRKNPTRAFTELYTAYLLTRSPAMAYRIWKESQGAITASEIREGEAMARRNYREIRERQSSISH
jgi:hypothetical protein